MNVVSVKQNLENLSCPFVLEYGYYRINPANGCFYSIGTMSWPGGNGIHEIKDNILMSVYDSAFNQLNYAWGIPTEKGNDAGQINTIDFGSDEEVYFCGGMDKVGFIPRNLYVACFDKDLNKIGEVYYRHPTKILLYTSLVARPEGGCLVSCEDFSLAHEPCVYKVTLSDFLDIEEAHMHGFAMAAAYPNPGGRTPNIRTALKNAEVEVYDEAGRLAHRGAITGDVTPIDAVAWPAGVYVWKVYSNGAEAESGKRVKG